MSTTSPPQLVPRALSSSLLLLLISLLLFAPTARAQQLLDFSSGALPQCAQNCQTLKDAQTVCVPPSAPTSNQRTYLGCFCQSGYLTTLRSDASNVCGTVCQGADLTSISQWYTRTCAALANGVVATPAGTDDAATATTVGGTSTATSSGVITTGLPTPEPQGGWWANHWQWVLMIILIIIGLALIAVAAVLFRRRRRRKRDLIDGPFNKGITGRGMTANPAAAPTYPYPEAGGDRDTPSAMGSIRGRDDRLASASTLPRAAARLSGSYAGSPADIRHSRIIDPDAAAESSKGKGMSTVSENDSHAMTPMK